MSRLVQLVAGSRRTLLPLALVAVIVLPQGGSGAPSLALRSGPATFVISSRIYALPASGDLRSGCSGSRAVLTPGVTRCLVLQVDSALSRDIQVDSLVVALDTSQHAPDECTAQLVLPHYGGDLLVPAYGRARTPGLPILLRNTRQDQDSCQGRVFHFRLSGTAIAAPHIDDPTDPGGGAGSADLPDTGSSFSPVTLALAGTAAGALVGLGLLLVLLGRRRRDEVGP
ncbi:MAG: LPXTG cell wall anchor domain-containing protein [Nocardioidaceae bacterium]|nr:LPXTG cell wall anchor domain-containing protein [Nocardioidaceae bacterium]